MAFPHRPLGSALPRLFLTAGLWLMPWVVEACPRCIEATPYKSGLQLAIAVLLPLPFALVYFLYRFIRQSIPPGKE